MAMRARFYRLVDVPIDIVWQVLTDHEGMSSWSPGVHVTLIKRGLSEHGGAGAIRMVKMAGRSIREEITEAEAPKRLAYRCLSGMPLKDYAGEVVLSHDRGGTGVTWVLAASTASKAVALALGLYARIFATALCKAAQREFAAGIHQLESSAAGSMQPASSEVDMVTTSSAQAEASARDGLGAEVRDMSDSSVASLADAFQRTAARSPESIAISTPDGTVTLTWREYSEQVCRLAEGLYAHGIRRGDTVALMMLNRPEFFPLDSAALHLGAIPFSIYNTSSPEQIRVLLDSAKPTVLVCDSPHLEQVLAAQPGSSVKHVFCVDGADTAEARPLAELATTVDAGFDFEASWRAVGRDDVAVLIYTSGTTGVPKGVQLTHGNLLAQVAAADSNFQTTPSDRVISFLPSAHIADRWAGHYIQIVCGNQVFPVADRSQLFTAMGQVRPTMYGAVPQLWQKFRAVVETIVTAESPEWREEWEAAVAHGQAMVQGRQTGNTSAETERAFTLVDNSILADMRSRLGLDQARIVMSGAAPLPGEVVAFFNAIGIPLVDSWGMSELSCTATGHPGNGGPIGSVGKALPGVQIRLAEDGEVLVRGPIVMKGYLGRADLTAEVIDADGWLHTGDVGQIDSQGYVSITERKKELIVTGGGKNISPSNIESGLRAACPLISQVAVIGDNRPYLVGLVVLDLEAATQFAAVRGIEDTMPEIAASDVVIELVRKAVERANSAVSAVEHIRKFVVLADTWVPGSDVLTHTMKLRRRAIDERYADVIDLLYRLPREEPVLRLAEVPEK